MTRDETQASPFAALFEWERKNSGGGGGRAKIEVEGKTGSFKLRPGGRKGERRFHAGHRLAGTKINNIVKVKFVKNNRDATRHIIQHIDYIQKREREMDEPERKFYGRDGRERSRDDVIKSVMQNRGEEAAMFKIILSPKQNELNQIAYTAEIMRRFEENTGIKTDWSVIEHRNTQYHHVHIVMPGKDMDGRSYRLEKEHLDLMRELANEYQYELQGIDYEYEKQVEQEFGYTRDEANTILQSVKDTRDMKDLGVYKPEVDKLVRDDLLPPTNFDEIHFAQQLQKEFWRQASQDFKDLQSEIARSMQERNPELYPGFLRHMQVEQINHAYFSKLKEFHPAEYYRYIHDPALDRAPVVERLKQAFPEWFDPIVEQLKEGQPGLFANYEKPSPTDREIMNGLKESNPELFPELSKQIQERQLNTVTMAMLATVNPSRLEQILTEADPERQKELLDKTRTDYKDTVEQARDRLKEKFPEIYKWGEKEGPSEREIMKELVKEHPTLFPQATVELQKREIDNALFERLREENPELAGQIEFDPQKRGVATTVIRSFFPGELKKAMDLAKEQQPELFKYEQKGPSEHEIMRALEREHPELYPQIMRNLKEQEIDKAYFERATKTSPDGLRAYIDNPELERAELFKVLRSMHPEWRLEIDSELKERQPELFRFDRQFPTDDERFAQLQKTSPGLFHGMKPMAEPAKELEIERSPRLEKLEQVKEQLVDRAYFEKGRENMSDGLITYLENADYDRKYIIEGLKLSHPEWTQDIEQKLKELHPQLFQALDKEEAALKREAQERATDWQRLATEHLKERFLDEAILLITITGNKELKDVAREEGDEANRTDKDDLDDSERQGELMDTAEEAILAAEQLKTGKEWAGMTAFLDPAFVAQPLDLTQEAQALFDSQRDLSKELNEFESDATQLFPNLFKIEDALDHVKQDLSEIEKDDSERGE